MSIPLSVKGRTRTKMLSIRQRLHQTGSIRIRSEIGTDKPCVCMKPGRSILDRFSYPELNGFTCENDSVSIEFLSCFIFQYSTTGRTICKY